MHHLLVQASVLRRFIYSTSIQTESKKATMVTWILNANSRCYRNAAVSYVPDGNLAFLTLPSFWNSLFSFSTSTVITIITIIPGISVLDHVLWLRNLLSTRVVCSLKFRGQSVSSVLSPRIITLTTLRQSPNRY